MKTQLLPKDKIKELFNKEKKKVKDTWKVLRIMKK